MAVTLADADRAVAAAEAAGVILQVGFNRRFDASFRAAHDLVAAGRVGTPQLLRSLTRDPGIPDPGRVPPSGIFLETLIHDFDTLRHLNPGAEPVEVYAVADALAYPDFKDQGLLDTAVVVIRIDNGAMATAEASFNAVFGYDIRGEVFGSAGMVTAGDPRRTTIGGLLRRRGGGRRHLAAQRRSVPRRLLRRAGRLRGLRPHRRRPRPHRAGRPRRPGHRPGRHPLGRDRRPGAPGRGRQAILTTTPPLRYRRPDLPWERSTGVASSAERWKASRAVAWATASGRPKGGSAPAARAAETVSSSTR